MWKGNGGLLKFYLIQNKHRMSSEKFSDSVLNNEHTSTKNNNTRVKSIVVWCETAEHEKSSTRNLEQNRSQTELPGLWTMLNGIWFYSDRRHFGAPFPTLVLAMHKG